MQCPLGGMLVTERDAISRGWWQVDIQRGVVYATENDVDENDLRYTVRSLAV